MAQLDILVPKSLSISWQRQEVEHIQPRCFLYSVCILEYVTGFSQNKKFMYRGFID